MGKLRTSEFFNDSNLTLIAVESVDLRYHKTNSSCVLHGSIDPVAVIVRSADGTYALDMEAKPVNLDQIKEDIPELYAMLHE